MSSPKMNPDRWARVKAVLDSALNVGAEDRDAYLSSACAQDSSLRSEVESLLRAQQQSPASFMRTGTARSTLPRGIKLDHYEIIELIGRGGMGEVYRALDLQLRRYVAIKVLPPLFTLEPDRLSRFEQEARAAAALNHSNILAIHHFGTHEGQPFIVSELLHGHTLREELKDGALPLRIATDYALQIARGLAAAHDQGIVHRDLKPENIFIAKQGQVKILDFGLAKLHVQSWGEEHLASSKTETGMIMGTPAYMSPEQVRGQQVDARTDIFSFGAILFELLAGRSFFKRETPAETQSAILKEEPPAFAAFGVKASPALERIVRRCLEKTPERRFQSALDVEFALEAISTSELYSGEPHPRNTRKSRRIIGWLVGLAVILGFAVLFVSRNQGHEKAADQFAARFFVSMPANVTLLGSPVLSPNGQRAAFLGIDQAGKKQLWVRPLDSFSAQPLPGTEDAFVPFWSPDSNSLAFVTQDNKLKKIELKGGAAQVLCNGFRRGAWNVENVIIFGGADGRLFRVSVTGGEPKPVTELDASRKEIFHDAPEFLPDGERFLYHAHSSLPEKDAVYVGSVVSSEKKLILTGQLQGMAVYSPFGFLLFTRGEALMAQSFDVKSLQVSGNAIPIIEPIWTNNVLHGTGVFSLSHTGVLAYRDSVYGSSTELAWYDRNGARLTTVADNTYFTNPSLSADGKKLAVGVGHPGRRDIWIYDLDRAVRSRLTFDPADDLNPTWSRDGQRIFFSSDRNGRPRDIYQQAVNGVGTSEILVSADESNSIYDISPDERFVVYESGNSGTTTFLPLFGERKPIMFPLAEQPMLNVHFSPDGRYIAYSSFQSGRPEVYVRTFPKLTGKWQVSTESGVEPMWRGDGREMFYLSGTKLIAVDVNVSKSGLDIGPSRVLFEYPRLIQPPAGSFRNRYVVSKNGKRFLFVTQSNQQPQGFNILTNWMTELKK